MNWIDEAAAQLEQLLADPLKDAVRGSVRVVSASAPTGRSPYQECRLDVIVEAPGIPETNVRTEAVVSRRHWPEPGLVLPARISRSHPETFEIDWDSLAR